MKTAQQELAAIEEEAIKPLKVTAERRVHVFRETSALAQRKLKLKKKKKLLTKMHARGHPVSAVTDEQLDDTREVNDGVFSAFGDLMGAVHSL